MVHPFPTREDLMVFVRDVARLAPAPGDSGDYSRGVLTTLAQRAADLTYRDRIDALSTLSTVPAPRDAA